MSEYVFEVSKEGYDVFTATDKEKVFSSKRVGLKVRKKMAVSVEAGVVSAIPHGLNYKPSVFGFQAESTHGMMMTNTQFPGFDLIDGLHDVIFINVWVDRYNIYVYSGTWGTVYVFLLTERGSNA